MFPIKYEHSALHAGNGSTLQMTAAKLFKWKQW